MTSLLVLPPEIQLQILSHLDKRRFQQQYQGPPVSILLRSLSSLGRTCKHFHRITQPMLYHTLQFHGDEHYNLADKKDSRVPKSNLSRDFLLVRTLLQHPELAEQVSRLEANFNVTDEDGNTAICQFPKDFVVSANHVFEKYQFESGGKPARLESDVLYKGDTVLYNLDVLFRMVLCVACPNVEYIAMYSYFMTSHAEVQIKKPPTWEYLRGVNTSFMDSHFGVTFDDEVTWIVNHAPNLEVLSGEKIKRFTPSLQNINIRTLILKNSFVSRSDIVIIAKHFPLLESFSYSCNTSQINAEDGVGPQEMVDSLSPLAETLKHLRLDYSEPAIDDEGMEPLLQSMMGLYNLESVDLDMDSIYSSDDTMSVGSVQDLFPTGLQKLTLRGLFGQDWHTDLLRVVEERCPKVERVVFRYSLWALDHPDYKPKDHPTFQEFEESVNHLRVGVALADSECECDQYALCTLWDDDPKKLPYLG